MEKFSEMKYVRPDGEAYIQTIQKETKNFNEAADFEGAHQAFVAILNANSHFNTTRVMASIRNSQDTNDESIERRWNIFSRSSHRLMSK